MEKVINFYKWLSDNQILKSREQHHILVGCFLIFALCANLFILPERALQIILVILWIRILDIHIHNTNVAFLDGFKFMQGQWFPIQNISSYKRIFVLNIIVSLELLLYTRLIFKYYNHSAILLFLILLAFIPTFVLFIRCVDYKLKKYFNC